MQNSRLKKQTHTYTKPTKTTKKPLLSHKNQIKQIYKTPLLQSLEECVFAIPFTCCFAALYYFQSYLNHQP